MKAVLIDEYGGNDVVRYAEVDRPEPQAGEVRVKKQEIVTIGGEELGEGRADA